MTQKQIDDLDRKTWTCLKCQMVEANPRPSPEDTETQTQYKTKNTKIETLKILQYNIDSLLSKTEELKTLLKDEDIGILAIQETKLIAKDKLPKIPGYTLLRRDRTQLIGNEKNRGGLLIGIRKDIPYKEVNIEIRKDPDKFTEWNSIEVPLSNNTKLRLTNIYVPPPTSTSVDENNFSPDLWPKREYDILLGDINAHSTIWDDIARNDVTDRRGEKIEDWLAENNMACINTGEATHVSRSTGKEGTPDTSFIHSSLLDKVSWKTTNKMGSDHKPIIITYEDQMMKIKTRTKYKWKISEADWEKFTNEIEQKIPQNFQRMSVNKLEKKLRKTIWKSAKDHIGKKKITQHTKAWLTPEIKESIKKRNELRKTVAQNRTEWIEACKSTAELITEKKKELWKEYVDGISATTSSIQIWRTIKGMDGRRPPDRNNETLEANGKSYTDDKDKANLFAKTYRGFAKIPIQKEDRNTRKYIRRRMKRRPLVHQEAEQEFTMDELDRALSEAKNNKATGEDDIPYEMLKNLGKKAKEVLLESEYQKSGELQS